MGPARSFVCEAIEQQVRWTMRRSFLLALYTFGAGDVIAGAQDIWWVYS